MSDFTLGVSVNVGIGSTRTDVIFWVSEFDANLALKLVVGLSLAGGHASLVEELLEAGSEVDHEDKKKATDRYTAGAGAGSSAGCGSGGGGGGGGEATAVVSQVGKLRL